MNAQELFLQLDAMSEGERVAMDLFIRTAPVGMAFNIEPVSQAEVSTYGCFGKSLPCMVFEDGRFTQDDAPEK